MGLALVGYDGDKSDAYIHSAKNCRIKEGSNGQQISTKYIDCAGGQSGGPLLLWDDGLMLTVALAASEPDEFDIGPVQNNQMKLTENKIKWALSYLPIQFWAKCTTSSGVTFY